MTGSQHTPGPWAWFGNAETKSIYLATEHSGRRYVTGFQRWGTHWAQPTFQPLGKGLVPARDLLQFQVGDRSIVGLNAATADESVYRYDIRGIACADAHLIAAAPDLLEACKLMMALLAPWEFASPNPLMQEAISAMRVAIAKTRGSLEKMEQHDVQL